MIVNKLTTGGIDHMPRQPRNTLRQAVTRSNKAELEHYAQLYLKYSVIIKEQTDAIRHRPNEVMEAHAKVTEEHNERQKVALQNLHLEFDASIDGLLNTLDYYRRLCEIPPQTLLELS
jgi:galactokinase/mevalonate kinase-like predicted kinase